MLRNCLPGAAPGAYLRPILRGKRLSREIKGETRRCSTRDGLLRWQKGTRDFVPEEVGRGRVLPGLALDLGEGVGNSEVVFKENFNRPNKPGQQETQDYGHVNLFDL